MAKAKVTLEFNSKLEESIKSGIIDQATGNTLGQTLVKLEGEFLDKGISPVKGEGRFEAYAAQRVSGKPKRSLYPYSVQNKFPSKQLRPVNLSLNGKFRSNITFRVTKDGIEFGHINMDDKTKELFEAHNEGKNKNVPQRKYLPNKRGEEFVVTIMNEIKDIVSKRIKNIIKGNR